MVYRSDLFGKQQGLSLPIDYQPIRPNLFNPERIFLAKGSQVTPESRRFIGDITALYPEAEIIECLNTPHNRIDLHETESLALHQKGKRTLVFGELKSAVRFSEEAGNTCPNYWHFSPYGFCPYDCKYCYLAGTHGVKFSPTVKIYVNLREILQEVDLISRRLDKPTSFYLGKLQDPLALDPLTAYSTVLIPFFASHPIARLTLLTKSVNIERLLHLRHEGHTILSWSLNPPEVANVFEENVPTVEERLIAMNRVAAAGYPVRAVMMPVIPVDDWQEVYTWFTHKLLETVPIQRLTIGGICIYRGARALMDRKIGSENLISERLVTIDNKHRGDGRARYTEALREEIYSVIIETARRLRPELEIALCLEEESLWRYLGLENNMSRCNCVL